MRVRREIYEECRNRQSNYPDISLETEQGPMNILDYINHIQSNGFYGGELEISVAAELYNINIATYMENRDINNNIIGFTNINYYNHNDNNEHRHLLILTNIDNIHFRLGYDTNKHLDLNYKVNKKKLHLNEDIINLKDNDII